jgi:Carboxypeptidase regulatory-like domain
VCLDAGGIPVRQQLLSTWISLSVLAFFAPFLALSVSAQQLGAGGISGEVSDPQSAVVRNAQVVVSRKDTGLERKTSSNAAGLFAVNNLAPGTYELQIRATGFADYLATIHLEVGQQTDIKAHLGVKEQKEVVDINDLDAVPLVDTTSSTVDGVINSLQIDNLPLNGRNFLELALLTPGNTIAPNFDPTKQGTVVISSAGQLGRGGNVSIDGMDDNDDVVGGMLLNVPEDAVQEFQVATNRFSAELGRSGSAVVNVVTKSGTNTMHGSASVYARDKALQAATPIFNPTNGFSAPGDQTPQFRREQYSGTLGGPLVRDKAWWFGAFEYRDELGGVVVGSRNLATQKIDTGFASVPLTDPMGTIRGDWKISEKDTLTAHYSIERLEATGAASFLSGQPIGSALERQDLANHFQTFQTS